MNINVTATKVTIDKGNIVNKGEYNIRDCNFTLSEEYNGLVCKALFTVDKTKKTYEQSIVNNKCTIPYEVTVEKGAITLGVIGYEIQDDELIKRYSPLPYHFTIEDGSYVEDIENQSTPTPSELEQLDARLSQVEIDAAQVEINTQDISDIKQEQITQNNDILLRSLITETGSQIELSLNSTNFKMTATLKDKNGNTVGTSNEIDLPLESVVVNASYDSTTKEIILTLQNGNTVRFSVADLVSGLVSNTDYPTSSKAGVIKTSVNYGTTAVSGLLTGVTKNYSQYAGGENNMFISKGTLENVITGKQLINETQLDESQATQDTAIQTLQAENTKLKEQIAQDRATYPTTTGEGENITLDKTAELEFIQPPLPRGNSEQVQYSGKNLLAGDTAYANTNTDTKTSIDLQIYGGDTSNTQITRFALRTGISSIGRYSFVFTTTQSYTLLRIKHSGSVADLLKDFRINLEENTTYAISLDITGVNPTVAGGFSFEKVQVEKSSTATSYEPYVGGTASPNPSYPQEITNVTGDVEVLLQNKNLFDKDNIVSGKRLDNSGEATIDETSYCTTNYFIPVKPNTSYYSSVAISQSRAFCFYDSSKNFISRTMYSGQNVITTTSDTYYMKISILLSEIDTEQIEKNTTATTYTPHKEQTFTFPLGNQRMYLGDYLADDGIHHVRKQVVFNGTENWSLYNTSSGLNQITYRVSNPPKYEGTSAKTNDLMCSHFTSINYDSYWTKGNSILFAMNDTLSIQTTMSLNDFKAYLAQQNANGKPLTVEYELATEEITPYTTEQQQAYDEIKQALSYEEQTNISGSSDEANPLFSVEAYQSIKLVLASLN